MSKQEFCSCGMPQSKPIPHEHDLTDREKRIIIHFLTLNTNLLEACKRFVASSSCGNGCAADDMTCDTSFANAAIASAEGK